MAVVEKSQVVLVELTALVQIRRDRRAHEHEANRGVVVQEAPRQEAEDVRVDAALVHLVDDEVRVVSEPVGVVRQQ